MAILVERDGTSPQARELGRYLNNHDIYGVSYRPLTKTGNPQVNVRQSGRYITITLNPTTGDITVDSTYQRKVLAPDGGMPTDSGSEGKITIHVNGTYEGRFISDDIRNEVITAAHAGVGGFKTYLGFSEQDQAQVSEISRQSITEWGATRDPNQFALISDFARARRSVGAFFGWRNPAVEVVSRMNNQLSAFAAAA